MGYMAASDIGVPWGSCAYHLCHAHNTLQNLWYAHVTHRDVNEEKTRHIADLQLHMHTLEQRTQAAELRAEQATTAADLAQEEIGRRRDEGDALHARVQHLEREVNELANRMRVRVVSAVHRMLAACRAGGGVVVARC